MKTLSLLFVLLFAPIVFADAGPMPVLPTDSGVTASSDAGAADAGAVIAMPVEHVMGTVGLSDGGLAPAMMLPDGGVITATDADDINVGTVAKDIIDAGRTKNWKLLIAGLVILLTWGVRLFGGKFIPFLKTDRGGVATALVIATVGALFNAWKAGVGISVQLFIDAASMGVFSIGGFTAAKKVFFPADKPAAPAPVPAPTEPPKA